MAFVVGIMVAAAMAVSANPSSPNSDAAINNVTKVFQRALDWTIQTISRRAIPHREPCSVACPGHYNLGRDQCHGDLPH